MLQWTLGCNVSLIYKFVFSGYMPRNVIGASYDSSIFSFLRNPHSVSSVEFGILVDFKKVFEKSQIISHESDLF